LGRLLQAREKPSRGESATVSTSFSDEPRRGQGPLLGARQMNIGTNVTHVKQLCVTHVADTGVAYETRVANSLKPSRYAKVDAPAVRGEL
jgi:hypothetical protein